MKKKLSVPLQSKLTVELEVYIDLIGLFFGSRYLAGTEEGHIHKCSCSYNEQYLESYHGHTVRNR